MFTDPGDEREGWLDEAVRELKRPAPGESRARRAVLDRVRAEGTPSAGWFRKAWSWLNRPRPVPVSPLAGLVGAAVVAVAVALGSHLAVGPRGASAPMDGRATPTVSAAAGLRPVNFVLVAPEAANVFVVGDFNDWDPRATPLVRSEPGGVWTASLALEPGLYQYSYLVDGRIRAGDVDAPRAPADEFGGGSSVVLVEGAS